MLPPLSSVFHVRGLRWALPPLALVFAINWVFVLPSALRMADAEAASVVASQVTLKGVPYTVFSTPRFGELRVNCSDAPELCQAPVPPHGAPMQVWLQDTGPLMNAWVVAAEFDGLPLVSEASQRPRYRRAKLVWGLCALALVGATWAVWRRPRSSA